MAKNSKDITVETSWLKEVRGLFRGVDRDLGYAEPGYAKYTISKPVPGYIEPARLSLEMPLKTAKESIDKEQSPLPMAGGSPFEREFAAFEREVAAFERLLPALLESQEGNYVAVLDGQVIDADADEFALARRMLRTHRGQFVLIRRVSHDQPPEDYLESPEW